MSNDLKAYCLLEECTQIIGLRQHLRTSNDLLHLHLQIRYWHSIRCLL